MSRSSVRIVGCWIVAALRYYAAHTTFLITLPANFTDSISTRTKLTKSFPLYNYKLSFRWKTLFKMQGYLPHLFPPLPLSSKVSWSKIFHDLEWALLAVLSMQINGKRGFGNSEARFGNWRTSSSPWFYHLNGILWRPMCAKCDFIPFSNVWGGTFHPMYDISTKEISPSEALPTLLFFMTLK